MISSFKNNIRKMELMKQNFPDLEYICLDKSDNQYAKPVSLDDAIRWNFDVSQEDIHELFTYISNEIDCRSVATGEGWKYTWIKTSKEEISCKANSYPDFSFDWGPKESEDERIDFNALELDPETDPNGYFQFPTSYARQGWPVHVSYSCPAGEYTLRFRVKSNHDVNCTMKFIITSEE